MRGSCTRVQVASDGPSACQAALNKLPDVVLLDLALPGMDGWEVAKRLRGRTWEKKPFLIALTGYGGEEDRRRSLEAGIDLHLVKPVEPDFLRRVLERFYQCRLRLYRQTGRMERAEGLQGSRLR